MQLTGGFIRVAHEQLGEQFKICKSEGEVRDGPGQVMDCLAHQLVKEEGIVLEIQPLKQTTVGVLRSLSCKQVLDKVFGDMFGCCVVVFLTGDGQEISTELERVLCK